MDAKEESNRKQFARLARAALHSALDPGSPDCLDFNADEQNIVDVACLAQGILWSLLELWKYTGSDTRYRLAAVLQGIRRHKPVYNNHLLFSACIEAALYRWASTAVIRCESIMPSKNTWNGTRETDAMTMGLNSIGTT